jgi:MFS family permease
MATTTVTESAWLPGFLRRERTIAPPGFNRWLIPPAALAVHLCIGQVYATSVYKTALVANFDSSLTAIGIIFSIAIVMLGLSAALLGTWVDHNGPRAAMVAAAVFWSAGFMVAALGISTGQLWLVYLGYGVIGGIGLGIGYISPVSTLIKWFPDRPGLATGMAIMGFGGGALIASPLSGRLLSLYDSGFDPADAASVATGSAVASLFVTLGLIYLAFMLFGAFTVRVPADDWVPADWDPSTVKDQKLVTTASVSAGNAIRTRQFWLLWVVLFCNVTAGIGILEQAAPMIQDFFRKGGTSTVTVAAAGGFVGLLSLANMGGRFLWSTTSDFIGRKPIYAVYLGGGIVLYILLAFAGHTSTALFVLLAAVIISFYGGGFATVPAYLRDLFGTFEVGAIHGRLLTAWSAAGVAGPLIVNKFLDAEGTPGKLNAGDYKLALLTMVVLLAIGFVANLLISPVDDRFHEPAERSTEGVRA